MNIYSKEKFCLKEHRWNAGPGKTIVVDVNEHRDCGLYLEWF